MYYKSFFKANKDVTKGSWTTLRLTKDKNSKPAFYVQIVKQHSWNESEKKGSFSENMRNQDKSISVKLSQEELAEISMSIQDRANTNSLVHKTDKATVQISMNHFTTERDGKTYKGHSLSIKRGEDIFKANFSYAEAEVIKMLFAASVLEISRMEFEEDQKRAAASSGSSTYSNNSNSGSSKPSSKEESSPVDDDDLPF